MNREFHSPNVSQLRIFASWSVSANKSSFRFEESFVSIKNTRKSDFLSRQVSRTEKKKRFFLKKKCHTCFLEISESNWKCFYHRNLPLDKVVLGANCCIVVFPSGCIETRTVINWKCNSLCISAATDSF